MSQEVYQAVFQARGGAPRASSLPYKGITQISASGSNATFMGEQKSVVVTAGGPNVLDMPSLAVVAFENTFLRLVQRSDGEELLQYPYHNLALSKLITQSSSGIELKKFSETLGAYLLPEKGEWVVFDVAEDGFMELGRLSEKDEPFWAFSGTWTNLSLGFDTTADINDLVFYGGKETVGFFLGSTSVLLLSDERIELQGDEIAENMELVEIATGFRDVLKKLNRQVGIRACEFAYAEEQATAAVFRVLDRDENLHQLLIDFDGIVEQQVLQTGVKSFHSYQDTVALVAGGAIWATFGEDEVQKLDLADNELITAVEFGIPFADKVIVYYESATWESEARS